MEELTPEQKFHAEEPEITVPRDLINGKPKNAILEGLLQLDYSELDAEEFISKVEKKILIVKNNPEQIEELKKESKKYYAIGLPLILLSVVMILLMKVLLAIIILAVGLGFLMKADGDTSSLKEIQKLLKEKDSLPENPDNCKD